MPTRTESMKLGWIGTGRMGYDMAKRLAQAGCDIAVWNRTKAKAEPLAQYGARIVDGLSELAASDIVFCMVSTWDDVKDVMQKMLSGAAKPRMVIECSSISLEGSAELRDMLSAKGIQYLAAPVSGNAKVVK
ncbi:MAG TPA: NAD(P)-binding domain-containing protein, partial [Burkholderiales bacterium]|nr:NAD(P)-binding domain-containing protein [Burkholderiales bacterium]